MPCTRIHLGGAIAIVCTRGPRHAAPCHYCSKAHVVLCDHKTPGRKKTCDRRLCRDHAHHVEPDLDFCPEHRAVEPVICPCVVCRADDNADEAHCLPCRATEQLGLFNEDT